MPHEITIERTGGVLVTLSGHVTAEEIEKLNDRLMAHEEFSRWRYQIWDLTGADAVEVSLDDLRRFAMQDAQAALKNPDQRSALVIRVEDRSGQDRIFHVIQKVWGGYESRTFFDLDAAREWAASR